MDTLEITDDDIMEVWDLCSECYLQNGYRISFPSNTDPTKTYQWRYLKAITNKFIEWEFDEATSKQFIQIAIQHCKEQGIIRKGLAALHQGNMLQICYDKLKRQDNSNKQNCETIKHIHQWLESQSNANLFDVLMKRNNKHEYCNLTKWYQASRISRLYLALSISCGKALRHLEANFPEERELLPRTTQLFMIRSDFLKTEHNIQDFKIILQREWRR